MSNARPPTESAPSAVPGDPPVGVEAREGMELGLPLDVAAFPVADTRSRDRLVAALLPLVLGWCTRLGGYGVDAEEAAHDVVMTVLRRIGDIRPGAPVEPWAFGITRRVIRSHRRRAWVRRWLPDAVIELEDHGASPSRVAEQNETNAQVQKVLERLPEMHREVIVLCDVEERSRPEVAALLGIPEGTVKSRLRLAREQFRKVSSGLGYSFGPDEQEVNGE